MSFFSKNRKQEAPKVKPTLDLSATTKDRIEIQVAKDASNKAKQNVEEINTRFSELLEDNGFHVKLYIAAGGASKGGRK